MLEDFCYYPLVLLPLTWEEHSLNSHYPFSLSPEPRSVEQRCPPETYTHVHLGVLCNTAVTDWYKGPACPRPLLSVYIQETWRVTASQRKEGHRQLGSTVFGGFRTPVVGWRKMAVDSRIPRAGLLSHSCALKESSPGLLWKILSLKTYHWRNWKIEEIEKLKSLSLNNSIIKGRNQWITDPSNSPLLSPSFNLGGRSDKEARNFIPLLTLPLPLWDLGYVTSLLGASFSSSVKQSW